MRKLISHMQLSLDGFMAGPGGELDFAAKHHDEAMWRDVFELMETVDTVLFGRKTYQLFEDYWPDAGTNPESSENEKRFAQWINKTRKVVVSKTLSKIEWENSSVVKGNAEDEVLKLKKQSAGDILVFGSSTLVTSLLNAGLVDELRTNVHPVVLGKGRPYFKDQSKQHPLRLMYAKTINDGVVGLHYRREE